MMVKFVFLAIVGLAILFNQPNGAAAQSCAVVLCGENSQCYPCAPNDCNTYTCDNPDGKGIFCTDICVDPGAHCICNPNYHRETPNGPCVPLQCPTQPPGPCDTIRCGQNEVCAPCGVNPCNTYDCDSPDGSGKACPAICAAEPACVCKPYYARATPSAPCTPLYCPSQPGLLCGDVVCGANEECSGCGQNECNTYSCASPTPECVVNCFVYEPKCVCKPHYHRETPCGPCVPLECDDNSSSCFEIYNN